jgi:hypothetical protein
MLAHLIGKTSIIKFKVITEDGFHKITSLFSDLKKEMEADFSGKLVECLYEIKIGDQSYSGPSYEEFEKQYKMKYKADNIRLIIQATDPQQQLNPLLARITLVLDRTQESSMSVVGGSSNWVNGVFSRFNDILKDIPTRNVWLHNILFEMTVQLLAVIVMTIFSVFLANKLSSLVQIKFSEVYVFIIIFLLLSNLWTYAGRGLSAIKNNYYPVVDIIKMPRRPLFLTSVTFVLLAAASWAVGYVIQLFLPVAGK